MQRAEYRPSRHALKLMKLKDAIGFIFRGTTTPPCVQGGVRASEHLLGHQPRMTEAGACRKTEIGASDWLGTAESDPLGG